MAVIQSKLPILAISMIIAGTTLVSSQQAAATGRLDLSDSVIYKKLTKAECKKKPGYVWIEASKRCVKANRGSY